MTFKLISTEAHLANPADPEVLQLDNGADPRELALDAVRRIDLAFPKPGDGRAFSQAFLLRRRLGFSGEIRATGEVLIDQLVQMQRTGFDAAVLRADQDEAAAMRQLERFGSYYQGDAVQAAPRFARAGQGQPQAPQTDQPQAPQADQPQAPQADQSAASLTTEAWPAGPGAPGEGKPTGTAATAPAVPPVPAAAPVPPVPPVPGVLPLPTAAAGPGNAVRLHARASPGFAAKLEQTIHLLHEAAKAGQNPGGAPLTAQASSLGAEDMVISHLVNRLQLPIGIFVLDTGMLHQPTLQLLEDLRNSSSAPVQVYRPSGEAVLQFVAREGREPMYRSIALRKSCCQIRKMEPLKRALAGKKAWITGLRREQSGERAAVPFVDASDPAITKFNPLADWTWGDVWHYIALHQVAYNPLHDQFFPSIGCAPCTRAISLGEDFRAGRWWWEDEIAKECGLHVATAHQPRETTP